MVSANTDHKRPIDERFVEGKPGDAEEWDHAARVQLNTLLRRAGEDAGAKALEDLDPYSMTVPELLDALACIYKLSDGLELTAFTTAAMLITGGPATAIETSVRGGAWMLYGTHMRSEQWTPLVMRGCQPSILTGTSDSFVRAVGLLAGLSNPPAVWPRVCSNGECSPPPPRKEKTLPWKKTLTLKRQALNFSTFFTFPNPIFPSPTFLQPARCTTARASSG